MEVAPLDNLNRLLQIHWALPITVRVERLPTGVNNASFLVEDDDQSFVLKQTLDTGEAPRQRFEHDLLRALQQVQLPFSVPSPVPTMTGNPVAQTPEGNVFVLTRLIAGAPPERGNPGVTGACAQALALLDTVMTFDHLHISRRASVIPGALSAVHQMVPDPSRAVSTTISDGEMAVKVNETLNQTEQAWRRATAGWPTQVIHADFYPSNVLVAGDKVTGVLDFEFAGTGHRAMDFAIGLMSFGNPLDSPAPHQPLLDAFARGYLRLLPLEPDELAAVPSLILMREAASFVGWLGRRQLGLIDQDNIMARGRRLLQIDTWLRTSGSNIVVRLLQVRKSVPA